MLQGRRERHGPSYRQQQVGPTTEQQERLCSGACDHDTSPTAKLVSVAPCASQNWRMRTGTRPTLRQGITVTPRSASSAMAPKLPGRRSPILHTLRKARKVVVDRRRRHRHALVLPSETETHTWRAMQSRNALATSAHSFCERRSLDDAQHASTVANSVAHGALAATFLGRTFTCSNFIGGWKKPQRGGGGGRRCHVVTNRQASGRAVAVLLSSLMVRRRVSPQSNAKTGTHTPLTQAQLAALASRNSSAMRYVAHADT